MTPLWLHTMGYSNVSICTLSSQESNKCEDLQLSSSLHLAQKATVCLINSHITTSALLNATPRREQEKQAYDSHQHAGAGRMLIPVLDLVLTPLDCVAAEF